MIHWAGSVPARCRASPATLISTVVRLFGKRHIGVYVFERGSGHSVVSSAWMGKWWQSRLGSLAVEDVAGQQTRRP